MDVQARELLSKRAKRIASGVGFGVSFAVANIAVDFVFELPVSRNLSWPLEIVILGGTFGILGALPPPKTHLGERPWWPKSSARTERALTGFAAGVMLAFGMLLLARMIYPDGIVTTSSAGEKVAALGMFGAVFALMFLFRGGSAPPRRSLSS